MQNSENSLSEAMFLASESYSVATYEMNFMGQPVTLLLMPEEAEFVALNS